MNQNQNEKIRELTEQLEEGVKGLYQSDKYREYLSAMSRFTSYSANNVLLILLQRPDTQAVAGYRSWETKFDRHVVKGAKAIQIIEPAPFKRKVLETVKDEDGNPKLDGDGNEIKKEVTKIIQGYKIGNVFALEDTEGKPLPTIVKKLEGDVPDYERIMKTIKAICPVPIVMEDIKGAANGYYSNQTKDIHVDEKMSEAMRLKTTIHEFAHAITHDENTGIDNTANRSEMEVTAESVAFVVCSYLGLRTDEYSFGYVGDWSENLQMKEIQAKMEVIRKAAGKIITDFENEWMKWEIKEKETPPLEVVDKQAQELPGTNIADAIHTSTEHETKHKREHRRVR